MPEGCVIIIQKYSLTQTTTIAVTQIILTIRAAELICLGNEFLLSHIVGNAYLFLSLSQHLAELVIVIRIQEFLNH